MRVMDDSSDCTRSFCRYLGTSCYVYTSRLCCGWFDVVIFVVESEMVVLYFLSCRGSR